MGQSELKQLVERRAALLSELGGLAASAIAGSFFERRVGGRARHCLSRMRGGVQRQTYVAAAHAGAVREAVSRHARTLAVLGELSELNLSLIKTGIGLNEDGRG